MFDQNEAVAATISDLGARACVDLFQAYGVDLTPAERAWGKTDERLFSGSMGFVGRQLRGTCLLAAAEPPLVASCPTNGALRDWVGELTNQLVGRIKMRLLGCGIEVGVTTPIVLSGVRIEPLPRARLTPNVFASRHGDVLVWVETEAGPDLVLGSERPVASAEGQVIVF